MSAERFAWLREWVADPDDIVRTFGTESNVKEIYDACHALEKEPGNVILNQFREFGNYVVHRAVTGFALERVFRSLNHEDECTLRAFVSASGSAGTLAAGDHLKATLGADVCAVEAVECPTLLLNGYGEHNIQGIGDKHVPLIHNVMNTDFVIGVSDAATDSLYLLFNSDVGRRYLARRTGVDAQLLAGLSDLGLSAIANLIGAIKYAKYMKLGRCDAVITVATDGAELYASETEKITSGRFPAGFDDLGAAEVYGRFVLGASEDHMVQATRIDRDRMFNLGYYTWVEQQGTALSEFDARRDQRYWDAMMEAVPVWDAMIDEVNALAADGF
jgi:cysteine synthase